MLNASSLEVPLRLLIDDAERELDDVENLLGAGVYEEVLALVERIGLVTESH